MTTEPERFADADELPDVGPIVIEDGEPVDNLHSEKQMRLLTEPLYASWSGPPPREDGARRPFFVASNVAVVGSVHEPPTAPDVLLSVDVDAPPSFEEKKHRSYFIWEFGKPPDVVIEIVSQRDGDELGLRRARYARMRVTHYVVWDRLGTLGEPALHVFELRGDLYQAMTEPWLESVGLGLTDWRGAFEGMDERWLRWRLADGTIIPTGAERADAERVRADKERVRADKERERADKERERADALAAKLRALGVDPDA